MVNHRTCTWQNCLATLFCGVNNKVLVCAFVAGLPEDIRQLLRAGSRMESLDLNQILTRARAVVRDDGPCRTTVACLGAARPGAGPSTTTDSNRCFECGGPNYFARNCTARHRRGAVHGGWSRSRQRVTCFKHGDLGHVASACTGNEQREGKSAPPSSPGDQ